METNVKTMCEECGKRPAIRWGMCDLCHLIRGTKPLLLDLPFKVLKN